MVRFLKLSAGSYLASVFHGQVVRSRWTPLAASHASAACPTTWRMRFCMQCARDPASSASGTISLAGAVTAGHSLPERKAGEGATACLTLRCARGCILHPCDALLGQRVDRSSDQLSMEAASTMPWSCSPSSRSTAGKSGPDGHSVENGGAMQG